MQSFDFKYHRRDYAIKMFTLAIIVFVFSVIAGSFFVEFGGVVHGLISYIGFGLLIWTIFTSNVNGVGVLHDDHVEIILKDKKFSIKYVDIEKIQEKVRLFSNSKRRWRIKSGGKVVFTIYSGTGIRSSVHLLPLENFMMALYRKLDKSQYVY